MRALILDMDGVLIDSNPMHVEAWRSYLSRYGLSVDGVLEWMHGKRNDQIVRDLFGAHLTEEDVLAHGAAKENLYRQMMRPRLTEHLVPGLVDFLGRHSEVPKAVASNAEPANVRFVLEEGGLRQFFPVAVDGHQVERPKPDPEIYRKVASLLGVPPGDCVVFEDSPSGIQAAKAAGARVVAVRTTDSELPPVDFSIRDFRDATIDRWLQGLS